MTVKAENLYVSLLPPSEPKILIYGGVTGCYPNRGEQVYSSVLYVAKLVGQLAREWNQYWLLASFVWLGANYYKINS